MKSISLIFNFLIIILFLGCQERTKEDSVTSEIISTKEGIEIVVLGTAQDAGAPHIGCKKSCCERIRTKNITHRVSCLGIIDHDAQQYYLLDATPDMPEQIVAIEKYLSWESGKVPDGIFLTHAHMGHYTGLMYLGKEALGAKEVPVYAMPRMTAYLSSDGPWSQLVGLGNIELVKMKADSVIRLSVGLSIEPFRVPHRDEYSETVGFKIIAGTKSALFIPDIDKWQIWDRNVVDEVRNVDYAFVDATFYNDGELSHRSAEEIPHPMVEESMDVFENESSEIRKKIHFIHMNHTNPLLNEDSEEASYVADRGFNIARLGEAYQL